MPLLYFQTEISAAPSLNSAETLRANGMGGFVTKPPILYPTKLAVVVSLKSGEIFRWGGIKLHRYDAAWSISNPDEDSYPPFVSKWVGSYPSVSGWPIWYPTGLPRGLCNN